MENKTKYCGIPDFTKIIYYNPNDFIIEDGVIVRIKRKYGKFKRTVVAVDLKDK